LIHGSFSPYITLMTATPPDIPPIKDESRHPCAVIPGSIATHLNSRQNYNKDRAKTL
jgi:hypothetical protein